MKRASRTIYLMRVENASRVRTNGSRGPFPIPDSTVTKSALFGGRTMLFSRRMQAASRSSFQPVEAGAILAGTTGMCAAGGALVGWGFGSAGFGVLGGVIVGIPAGVF